MRLNNLKDLYNLASQEKNDEIINDCHVKIQSIFQEIKKSEINCFLSGENDDLDIYLEIHAGGWRHLKVKTGQTCFEECI